MIEKKFGNLVPGDVFTSRFGDEENSGTVVVEEIAPSKYEGNSVIKTHWLGYEDGYSKGEWVGKNNSTVLVLEEDEVNKRLEEIRKRNS